MQSLQTLNTQARLSGFLVVLGLHAGLLYALWHYRVLPPPHEALTVFVSLLHDTPKPEKEKPQLPKPRHQPVRLEKPVEPPPQQIMSQPSQTLPNEPTAPPPAVPQPVIEAPLETAPPPSPPKPAGPVILSGELAVTCPQRALPGYPSLSRRLGEEGKTVLRVELDESGHIDRATIQSSSGYARLDAAALAAVRAWRCNPAMRDGVAVRAVAIQPFNFVLEGK